VDRLVEKGEMMPDELDYLDLLGMLILGRIED
jgi:hypothetical protein